ncbi:acyl-CoA dehydrogenase family protein [Chenggangzhangella methanolivorans]|uniref:Dibenzothiophene monooxygenase n=1 Tax=Chenggangzhangella methanolivorans TaxID=1437009 RepID=A0A9E6R6I7_9HYPH|nr:acyl-CoA dehydrogenase family protein [Chenggangzhangella methanolivorans]QZN98843.1 acyl-CoA dehydrogenase family protein [Chenggangzhangella methanolivorans]
MNVIARAASFATPEIPRLGSPEFRTLLQEIAAGASERDAKRILPFEQVELLRRARIGALRLRKEDGGAGVGLRELFATVVALGEADPNVAQILRNHFGFSERFCQPAPNDAHRPWARLISGGEIVGLAMTELNDRNVGGTGFDTKLSPKGDGYVLNGVKYFSTGSLFADYVMVRAQDLADRFVTVVVPAKRAGVTLIDDWDGFGQRLTGTGTTRFEDAPVRGDEVVFDDDTKGQGYDRPYHGSFQQLFLTAIVTGIIRSAATDAAALVKRRARSFSFAPAEKPADDPILQQAVGEISSAAFAAEAAVLAAADALERAVESRMDGSPDLDAAHEGALAAAKAKVVVDELAIRSGSKIFDVGGATSTKASANLDRHWRNARTLATHNPASYKARGVGQHLVTGERAPLTGFF